MFLMLELVSGPIIMSTPRALRAVSLSRATTGLVAESSPIRLMRHCSPDSSRYLLKSSTPSFAASMFSVPWLASSPVSGSMYPTSTIPDSPDASSMPVSIVSIVVSAVFMPVSIMSSAIWSSLSVAAYPAMPTATTATIAPMIIAFLDANVARAKIKSIYLNRLMVDTRRDGAAPHTLRRARGRPAWHPRGARPPGLPGPRPALAFRALDLFRTGSRRLVRTGARGVFGRSRALVCCKAAPADAWIDQSSCQSRAHDLDPAAARVGAPRLHDLPSRRSCMQASGIESVRLCSTNHTVLLGLLAGIRYRGRAPLHAAS